jgi:hypothetical protein
MTGPQDGAHPSEATMSDGSASPRLCDGDVLLPRQDSPPAGRLGGIHARPMARSCATRAADRTLMSRSTRPRCGACWSAAWSRFERSRAGREPSPSRRDWRRCGNLCGTPGRWTRAALRIFAGSWASTLRRMRPPRDAPEARGTTLGGPSSDGSGASLRWERQPWSGDPAPRSSGARLR